MSAARAVTAARGPTVRPMARSRAARSPLGRLLGPTLVVAHIPLGIGFYLFPSLALLYGAVTVVATLSIAAAGRRIERVLGAAAYVVGAEVLWRMTRVGFPWEVGKYVVIAILGMGLFRFFRRPRGITLPFVYIALLLPSTVLTLEALGVSQGRQYISFNLSGPFVLAFAVAVFRQVSLTWPATRRVLWALAAPVGGVLGVAFYTTITTGNIDFTTESNFVTSGGFGPNQVAAVLGLAALGCFVVGMRRGTAAIRLIATGLGVVFLTQGVLTFSRGAIWSTGIAVTLGMVVHLGTRGRRGIVLALAGVVAIVMIYLIVPSINDYTGGALAARYEQAQLSGREELFRRDLELWEEAPLWGVGPGMATFEREGVTSQVTAAHTEFSRLPAEHGVLGIVALVLLLVMAGVPFMTGDSTPQRAWALVMVAWSLTMMAHSAMRISAIPFIFGLAYLRVRDTPRERAG